MPTQEEISKHWGLSETDCKLLLAFTEELTLKDGLEIAGVRYEYGRSRVSKLKAKGYLQERRIGRDILLSCARRAETEFLWELALNKKTNKGKGFYFRFAGQQMNAMDAIVFIAQHYEAISSPKERSLREMLTAVIHLLSVGSFKLSEGELVTMTPKDVRTKLDEFIKQTELELQFAKALRAHGLLWEQSPTVWQSIYFGKQPGEKSIQTYERYTQ